MEDRCLYCLKSKCINCFLSQNNLGFGYLNASVIEVEIFTFLSNTQCVFSKSQRREKFFLSLFPSSLRPLSYSSNFYSAYCSGYIYVFRSTLSQRRALFGIMRRCLVPQQAHIESLPGNFNSALLRAAVFSIQACVSLVLVSCIRVNFPKKSKKASTRKFSCLVILADS